VLLIKVDNLEKKKKKKKKIKVDEFLSEANGTDVSQLLQKNF
jgi:hypothetical protein